MQNILSENVLRQCVLRKYSQHELPVDNANGSRWSNVAGVDYEFMALRITFLKIMSC